MKSRRVISMRGIAAALMLLLASVGSSGAPRHDPYEITDLEITLNTSQSGPRSLNDAGDVVGTMDRPGNRGLETAFLHRKRKTVALETPGGKESRAFAINHRGQIVGVMKGIPRSALLGEQGLTSHSFGTPLIWKQGKPQEIQLDLKRNGGFVAAGGDIHRLDINNSGQVTGSVEGSHRVFWSFLWQDGKLLSPEIAGMGLPLAPAQINDRGQIAGSVPGMPFLVETPSPAFPGLLAPHRHSRAVLWETQRRSKRGRFQVLNMPGPNGRGTRATGINNLGHVVGVAQVAATEDGVPVERAFLWDGERMRDLSPLGSAQSQAHAINDRGQVVLTSTHAEGGREAFLWQQGRMLRLNDLLPKDAGWDLQEAWDINNRGQMVGVGARRGFQGMRGFLLTPKARP